MSKTRIRSAIDAAAMVRRRKAYLSIGRRELCEYVTDFCWTFHGITNSNDLRFLSHLLAMVVEEAMHQSELEAELESAPPDASLPDTIDP